MSKQQNSSRSRAIVIAAVFGTFLAACAHQPSGNQVSDGLSPFNAARSQALSLVVSAKRTLDAADLNTLTIAYTGLEEKANAYVSFIVEAVTTSSFDPNRNSQYAANLQQAIASFDKTFATLVTTKQTLVSAAWVPAFAQALQARWDQYNGALSKMTPATKADLIADIKRDAVWPNYEDISIDSVATSH